MDLGLYCNGLYPLKRKSFQWAIAVARVDLSVVGDPVLVVRDPRADKSVGTEHGTASTIEYYFLQNLTL